MRKGHYRLIYAYWERSTDCFCTDNNNIQLSITLSAERCTDQSDIGYPAVAYLGFCQEGGIFENFKKAFPARSKIFFNIGKTQKREGHDPMSPLPLNTPVLPGYPCRLALTDRITGVVTLSLAREIQSCRIVDRHDSTCCHLSRLCRKITTDLLLGYTLAKASIWDR